ncbi:hypothetical protein SRABI84_00501 [Peribacillus simplex]|nr:hypothetical protein SRABI84_00501 [Peribacillus simplex]
MSKGLMRRNILRRIQERTGYMYMGSWNGKGSRQGLPLPLNFIDGWKGFQRTSQVLADPFRQNGP